MAATVFIVDDDAAVRDALTLLIESVGLACRAFESAADFLEGHGEDDRGCLILDVRMPGMSGLELQDRLVQEGVVLPTIFISGHADVSMAVHAMRAGAFDFLEKPFNDQTLIDRVNAALEHDSEIRSLQRVRQDIVQREATLTPREREIMGLVTGGNMNKTIAADLGLSERTVEIHRSHVMEKMQAGSLAELVRMQVILEEKL
ncbi:MAG: response regulator transcription factor [Gammaproteobacteria bacterium]|nr:response regulator transcription factor [Gammaproteobacteria bacterium]